MGFPCGFPRSQWVYLIMVGLPDPGGSPRSRWVYLIPAGLPDPGACPAGLVPSGARAGLGGLLSSVLTAEAMGAPVLGLCGQGLHGDLND